MLPILTLRPTLKWPEGRAPFAWCALALLLGVCSGWGQVLQLPDRLVDAPGGRVLAESLASLDRENRETRLVEEVLRGNVPEFLRRLVPVALTNVVDGRARVVTVFVTPDYVAVGSDTDYLLAPLTPAAAQRVADATAGLLPTRRMVDAIHAAAPLKLVPLPIPPSKEMVTLPVFARHNELVWEQRKATLATRPLGTLVAGDKKDLVLTPQLVAKPRKVAIYGWHRTNGVAIQPLYLGHADSWVDYSHGVRLVHAMAKLDGMDVAVKDLLADAKLSALLSDEGPLLAVRYAPVGRDSVEPHLERSEASKASVPTQNARSARADSVGKQGSTESRPTSAGPPPHVGGYGEWRAQPATGEQELELRLEPEVRVLVNAPLAKSATNSKPVHLILYALPNGNTIEQTIGKQPRPGDDWHFNIQHIGAQTRWLRERATNATLVVAYFEASGLSWPAWKRKHGPEKIPGFVERVRALFPGQEIVLTLNGHSGGGSFVFGYLDGHERIPAAVERIAFLDSNYGYDAAKAHADKLVAWLKHSPRSHLCVLAYHDSNALLNGKTFVSEAGGTWGRSHAMKADFVKSLMFASVTKDGLQTHTALEGRVKFFLKENPERKILHTVQVERNGFIHSMLTGTPAEGSGYVYLGGRAYEAFIRP